MCPLPRRLQQLNSKQKITITTTTQVDGWFEAAQIPPEQAVIVRMAKGASLRSMISLL